MSEERNYDGGSENPRENQPFQGIFEMLLFGFTNSNRMLRQQQGLLKHGDKILSEESRQHVLRKLAEKQANLTQKPRLMLIKCSIHAFLFVRLLGKQSSQPGQMIKPHVMRYLMTKRGMCVIPSSFPEKPCWSYFTWLLNSVFYHPSGFEYNSRNGWDHTSSCGFVHITTHPCKPLIAITGIDGKVWMGKAGTSANLFVLIHQPNSDDSQRATICAFHPFEDYIAVGVPGYVLVYKISESSSHYLSFKMLKKFRFFQDPGYFCTKPPQYPPCVLYWNRDGNGFTAVSDERGNLSRNFEFNLENLEAGVSERRLGYLFSFDKGHTAPLCSCTSPDGTSVATGYFDGKVFINDTKRDPKSLTVQSVLPADCSITKIEFYSYDPSILAIQTNSGSGKAVHLLKILPNGISIFYSFPNAYSFQFFRNMLIIQYEKIITFFQLNRNNFPVKLTEFTSKVGRIRSFCLTTLNGGVTLWISSHSDSKLHKAELTLK